jgi:hypothetical protein
MGDLPAFFLKRDATGEQIFWSNVQTNVSFKATVLLLTLKKL